MHKTEENGVHNTFKGLTAIAAWVLFLFGLSALLVGLIRVVFTSPPIALAGAYFGLGILSLFLSVVVIRMRQDMK